MQKFKNRDMFIDYLKDKYEIFNKLNNLGDNAGYIHLFNLDAYSILFPNKEFILCASIPEIDNGDNDTMLFHCYKVIDADIFLLDVNTDDDKNIAIEFLFDGFDNLLGFLDYSCKTIVYSYLNTYDK
jgi:hypothetical protein